MDPLNNALLLLEAWVDRFVTQTSVEVERLNICTNLYMTTAKEKLAKAGIEPDSVLGGEVDSRENRPYKTVSNEHSGSRPLPRMHDTTV